MGKKAPRLRKYTVYSLLQKIDPKFRDTTVTEYKFSNGRTFTRRTSRSQNP